LKFSLSLDKTFEHTHTRQIFKKNKGTTKSRYISLQNINIFFRFQISELNKTNKVVFFFFSVKLTFSADVDDDDDDNLFVKDDEEEDELDDELSDRSYEAAELIEVEAGDEDGEDKGLIVEKSHDRFHHQSSAVAGGRVLASNPRIL
jgi:hypothetical protein